MTQRPPLTPFPVLPAAPDLSRASGPRETTRGFSLYNLPVTETAASLNARRALMSRKSLSVEEAASLAGYEHLSSFSAAFKREYGFPPSQARR